MNEHEERVDADRSYQTDKTQKYRGERGEKEEPRSPSHVQGQRDNGYDHLQEDKQDGEVPLLSDCFRHGLPLEIVFDKVFKVDLLDLYHTVSDDLGALHFILIEHQQK